MKKISIKDRVSEVGERVLGSSCDPWNTTVSQFIADLPRGPAVASILGLAAAVRVAKKDGKQIMLFCGGHVVKVGLVPLINDLLRRKYITALAVNGAVMIHDYEMAAFGVTSEYVAESLENGTFGVTQETSDFLNTTVNVFDNHKGIGECLSKRMVKLLLDKRENLDRSLFASAGDARVPVTVHTALGADVIHMDLEYVEWESWGAKLGKDFKELCINVRNLNDGGVAIFVGSSVILPEVFLKAVALGRNESNAPRNFTVGVFDLYKQYRLVENVANRPTNKSHYILGPSEITFPIFAALLKM